MRKRFQHVPSQRENIFSKWSKEQVDEARAALQSVERGSCLSEKSETTGEVRRSAGVFSTFRLDREEYMLGWLRGVYGR